MPVFHVRERSWRNITFSGSCPAPLRCPCSVHFNHVVYTTGGISDATGALNDLVYAFDLESLVFYTVGTQPLPTFFHDLTVVSEGQFYSFGGVREENRVNHLFCLTLLHQPKSLAELCWQRVSHELRVFFPPDLRASQLEEVFREGCLTFFSRLMIQHVQTMFENEAGDFANDDTLSGIHEIYKYTKTALFNLLNRFRSVTWKYRSTPLGSLPKCFGLLFDSMMTAFTSIVREIEAERRVDPVECVSLFLTILFYCNGAPLKYVTRLPYGFRCLNVVCRHMDRIASETNDDTSSPPKRTLFATV
uniref:Ufd2P_core domain-containing protein n=1 Tax=Mesocestoides corti TaxID=53468 RepID=A0A5K3F695_MESCO